MAAASTKAAENLATSKSNQPRSEKRPLEIDLVLARVREVIRPFPKAALFQLAEEGYNSVKQPPGSFWQAHLHRQTAALLDLSRSGDVPASRGGAASLGKS